MTDDVTRNWKSNDPHARSSSVPWSKVIANTSFETRAGCRGRSVAALKSCVKLFRSWYPHLLLPLLSRSLSCFSSYLRHRRDIFSYFHPPIVSSLAWTQEKNDANETLFLWDNVGEKRWINDGCNLYRWKEQLLRCITLICRWNIRIYRSLKNIYFVLILRLFLDVEIIVFSFFFLLNWASRVRKKIRNNLAEESYMEYKIFIHFVFPLPDSKITSLSMIHRAAKYNWSLRKRPAREWSFMVTSRACSNTRSGM